MWTYRTNNFCSFWSNIFVFKYHCLKSYWFVQQCEWSDQSKIILFLSVSDFLFREDIVSCIFCACDAGFNIFEELLEWVPMRGTTTGEDIFNCVYYFCKSIIYLSQNWLMWLQIELLQWPGKQMVSWHYCKKTLWNCRLHYLSRRYEGNKHGKCPDTYKKISSLWDLEAWIRYNSLLS